MYASLIRVARVDGESDDEFFKRKRETVRSDPACSGSSSWPKIWAHQIVKWDEHLQRARTRQVHELQMRREMPPWITSAIADVFDAPSNVRESWNFAAQLAALEFLEGAE